MSTDTFTGTNGTDVTVYGPYAYDGGASGDLTIQGNALEVRNAAADNICAYRLGSFPNDQYAEIDFTQHCDNDDQYIGVALRRTSGENYVALRVSGLSTASAAIQVILMVAGSPTNIYSDVIDNTSLPMRLGLIFTGDELQIQVNGVDEGAPFTDATFTSGNPGIYALLRETVAAQIRADNAEFTDALVSALDQSAFRGRNDDGDEDGATWKAAENTNFSISTNTPFRLRTQINQAGSSAQTGRFKQQYRKVGDTQWLDVLDENAP